MNLLFFWVNEQGEEELVTAPLHRGDILPGAFVGGWYNVCCVMCVYRSTDRLYVNIYVHVIVCLLLHHPLID